MKLANFYTTIRIVLAPVFFVLFFLPSWCDCGSEVSVYLLLPLFVFMEFTDFLDGFYARKNKTVSDFGKIFDPFADVLANLTVLLVFVVAGYLPAFLYLIIIYREMSMMFVRLIAAGNGTVIAARKGGKTKTVLYIAAAGFSLFIESGKRLSFDFGLSLETLMVINLCLYLLAVIMSVTSFIDYLHHFTGVLKGTGVKK